jgi:hypothetical protein
VECLQLHRMGTFGSVVSQSTILHSQIIYLRMEKGDIFVDRLTKAMCSWDGIITSHEVPYRFGP